MINYMAYTEVLWHARMRQRSWCAWCRELSDPYCRVICNAYCLRIIHLTRWTKILAANEDEVKAAVEEVLARAGCT